MRPERLKTRIFLDSGNPEDTKKVLAELGFLDGQTTNPSLIAKHPTTEARLASGKKFTRTELLRFYEDVVREISHLLPHGSISVEVYADKDSAVADLLAQAREMFTWIPNAHIKLPLTLAGLAAAEQFIKEGGRVNLTLCFSEAQAAAVYGATRGAKPGDVFVSPFIGRLDDRGENGMDLIKNILQLYRRSDAHAEVLAASIRSLGHLLSCLALNADIITAPPKVLLEWKEERCPVPGPEQAYQPANLKAIPYQDLDLARSWREFDVQHDLTDQGLARFAADWNALLAD